ncbi:PspC domain-containing protein [Patescibacteria group bacterium]|nr:PspC domain-containing protein [Patescibacteria group bacterium]MBU2219663.1 PspC domain-containing protein [Patescibacteria group bacterium]MBU2264802.1 PspC domain-containing protein [Patescibacteria group bacterium]
MHNKTLHRSQGDKILAGVCGGLAEYFEVDSTIIRLLFILIVALGGSGLLIYLILWLIMPKKAGETAVINEQRVKEFANEIKAKANDLREEFKKDKPEVPAPPANKDKRHGGLFGWVLVILGVVFLANNFMPYWMHSRMISYWPLLLIFIGVVVIVGRK